ncbi:hypothetical protein [Microcoleus sp. F4-D5]|uniref:hypothetical protein n=1 Tax=Microcoleus sp. F4-D5 TaxID=2818760 RepID=UPI002FD69E81
MKTKLNLLCYFFGRKAQTRLQNRLECKPSPETARRAATHLHCLCVGCRMLPLPAPI